MCVHEDYAISRCIAKKVGRTSKERDASCEKKKKKRKEKKGERKKDAEFLGNFALNFNQTGRRFTAVHFVASSLIRFVNARPEIQQDPMYRLIRPAYEVTVIYASFNSPSLFSLVSGQR